MFEHNRLDRVLNEGEIGGEFLEWAGRHRATEDQLHNNPRNSQHPTTQQLDNKLVVERSVAVPVAGEEAIDAIRATEDRERKLHLYNSQPC